MTGSSFFFFFCSIHVLFYAVKFSLSSSTVLLRTLSIFIVSVLNLVDCLSPFCLVLFLEFCYALSFGTCFSFFVYSSWQPPCVCFYVLGRAATSSGLDSVA